MIYRGFNRRELDRITAILERHGVIFQISVPEESLAYINDKSKRVNHRFMDNLLQIDIDKHEFHKIPASDLSKLFDLRIYPEEESPFTEEELKRNGAGPEETRPEKKPDPHTRLNQIAAILAVLTVVALSLWRNGFF